MAAVSHAGLHAFFRQLSEESAWAVMLGGSTNPSPLNQWAIIGIHPRQTLLLENARLCLDQDTKTLAGPHAATRLFEVLEGMRQRCRTWPGDPAGLKGQASAERLPMTGGLFGCLGYGFYRWCDPAWQDAHPVSGGWPEAVFCEFEDWLFIRLETGDLTVLSEDPVRAVSYRTLWQMGSYNRPESGLSAPQELEAYRRTFDTSLSPEDFEAAVEKLRGGIAAGEIYQANLSMRFQKTLRLDPYALFERLCRRNPSPFSAFFKWPGGVIISNSPERLVKAHADGRVESRPIAGTRGRGRTAEEDARIGKTLLENEKERAEHLMLVDLIRNDLGRVCRAGSVTVDELLVLERYSHVTHLVSSVCGELREDAGAWDLLHAMFPGGTITGVPKIRCVDLLRDVEPASRGFYTGSLGYIDAITSAMDFNILIRSLFLRPTAEPLVYNAAVHAGAGIVHDAVGAHEYRECLRKAAALMGELWRLEQGRDHALQP